MVAVTRALFCWVLLCLSSCLGPDPSGRPRALVAQGDAFLASDQTDQAIEIYRRALDAESRFPPALHGLARAHLVRGDVEASLALCAAMEVGTPAYFTRARPDCASALDLAARTRRSNRDPAGELRLLERLRDLAPKTPGLEPRLSEVRLAAAEDRFRRGRRVEAVELYRELLSNRPDQLVARMGLVEALEALGRLDEARAVLSSGLARHPGSPELLSAMDRIDQIRYPHHPALISP